MLERQVHMLVRFPRTNWSRPLILCVLFLGIYLLGIGLSGCSPAPFANHPARHGLATTPDASSNPTPTLASLRCEPLVTLATHTDTPSPAFSVDSKLLVYRAEAGSRRDHDQRAEVRALRLMDLEDRVVSQFEYHPSRVDVYQPYEYGAPVPKGPSTDVLFHPAAIDEQRVFAGSERLIDPMGPPTTWQVELDGQHTRVVVDDGALPVLSPTGIDLLVQTATDQVVIELDSNQRRRVPGFMGVWAPDGESLVVHDQPYGTSFSGARIGESASAWATNEARGLTLVRGDETVHLTDRGGRPTWHPSGEHLVYEVPNEGGDLPRLVELTIEGLEQHPVAERGRFPAYHPSGTFLVFERDGAIVATDGTTERELGVSGVQPHFDNTGAFMSVLIEREERGGRPVRDVAIYRVLPE